MLSNTLPKDPSITSGQVHTTSPKLMIYTEGLMPSSLNHSLSLDDWFGKRFGLGYMLLRVDALYSVMSMSTSH
jgi:hypothetical protein